MCICVCACVYMDEVNEEMNWSSGVCELRQGSLEPNSSPSERATGIPSPASDISVSPAFFHPALFFSFFLFESGSLYVALVDLELMELRMTLSRPPVSTSQVLVSQVFTTVPTSC